MKGNAMAERYAAPEVVGRKGSLGSTEWNWRRADGTYVLKVWQDRAYEFSGGWGLFSRKGDGMYNFADADGNLLSDEWFDDAGRFGPDGGPAWVRSSDRAYNWLRRDGTYVLKDWAGWTECFSQGWGLFQRGEDNMFNFVNEDGGLLSDEWFHDARSFDDEGNPAKVFIISGSRNEWNWIRPDGTYVLKEWAKSASEFVKGWGLFNRMEDGKYNFANAQGALLSDIWYDDANPFKEEPGNPATVKKDEKWRALYGRKADGSADLSPKFVKDAKIYEFSCGRGLAAAQYAPFGKGYVDASMNTVGPDGFPFQSAEPFYPDGYGGKWAEVCFTGSGAYGPLHNLMGLDGTLALLGGDRGWAQDRPVGMSMLNMYLLVVCLNDTYAFKASADWSNIGRFGTGTLGKGEFLEGKGGRLEIRGIRDRLTGGKSDGFVVKDLRGGEHVVCLLDGRNIG